MAGALMQTAAGDDARVLARPGVLETLTSSFRECTQQSSHAVAREFWLTMRPWGFDLTHIRCRTHIWIGELDPYTPANGISALARCLGAPAVTTVPGLGHTAFIEAAPDVMQLMANAAQDTTASTP